MTPDRRRPLRGISPRSEPVADWLRGTQGHAQRLERRAFVLRLLQTDVQWTSWQMLQDQVEAYFGATVTQETVKRDVQTVGGVRIPLRPGSKSTKITLLEGHTPASLGLELQDRFAVDVLRIIRHEDFIVLDVSRGTTRAVHELLKLGSADGMLPTHLAILHDDDDTVVVITTTSVLAGMWLAKLQRILANARPKGKGGGVDEVG